MNYVTANQLDKKVVGKCDLHAAMATRQPRGLMHELGKAGA